MPTKVAILAHNGLIGKPTFKNLLAAHTAGKIELTVLHRPSSDLSTVPEDSGVATRAVDFEKADISEIRKAVEGQEVVYSIVADAALISSQIPLIEALRGSPTLKFFVQSDFGANWTAKELDHKNMPWGDKDQIVAKCKECNVPLVSVRIGLLDSFFFGMGWLGTKVKENEITVFKESLDLPMRITSLEYLGYFTAQLSIDPKTRDALAGKGGNFQVYNWTPTGRELADLLTNLHNGEPTKLVEFTQEQFDAERDESVVGALRVSLLGKWGWGLWGEDNSNTPKAEGWVDQSLEEEAKKYL
ncbi:hypothetical protein IAT38_002171 [Cryptococcus sp. DSM 104549]